MGVNPHDLMSKESRLSPRALTAVPSAGKNGRSSRSGKPILPLPDDIDGAGLDWSNLVETATKAIQSMCFFPSLFMNFIFKFETMQSC